MILRDNISSVIFRIRGNLFLVAMVFVMFSPQLLKAQEDAAPTAIYERPEAKVFKSLSAALQQPDSVYILELKGKKLTEIPEGVTKLPYLKVLDLGNNKIKMIPDAVLNMESLEELNLSNNKLKALPENIGKMTHLKKLALNRNVIQELPVSIGNMESLEVLELWDNEIGTLPEEMKNLSKLKVLELRGILFSEDQHKHFRELLPNTTIYLSPSCNCKF